MKPLIVAVGLMVSFHNGSTTTPSGVYPTTTTATTSLSSFIAPQNTEQGELSFTDIKTHLRDYSESQGVSYDVLDTVIQCESGYDSKSEGDVIKNATTSWGLVQIHLPAHPEVTKEQALDPDFSVHFIVDSFKHGHARWWSCYNMYYPPDRN